MGTGGRDMMPQEGMSGGRRPDTDTFMDLRADLILQAARTLGSVDDAEDVVQEVWLRWRRHQPDVSSARAWLRTVTRNLALDRHRQRKNWLYSDLDVDHAAPAGHLAVTLTRAEAVDDVLPGFTLLLRSLSELERAVFVLHDGLAWTYADIARLLARSEQAVRQLRHRARVNLTTGRQRFVPSSRDIAAVSEAYVDVCAGGDVSALLDVLAPDVFVVPPGRRLVEGRLRHEVAGIVLTHGSRLLLCRRRTELSWYPDVWDLPGSHLMRGEPAAACAVRAAKEGVGVSAVEPELLAEVSGDDFSLTLVRARSWEGEPRNGSPAKHDAVGFFSREEAARLRLANERYLQLFDRTAR